MSEDDSVKHEGKWTRDDLMPRREIVALAYDLDRGSITRRELADAALDAVVAHLNAHYPKLHPKDATPKVVWRERALEAERYLMEARRERDAAVARADQLRDERDDAVQSCIAVGRERDKWRAEWVAVSEDLKAARRQSDLADKQWEKWERKANEWKARAEKAEADRENIAEEFADFRVEVVAEAVKYRESNPQASGDDPAVYVVRESDIAAVEIERDERGWHGPGTTWTERSTSGEVRAHAEGLVRNVARCEAVARAIEAEPTVDPIEEKAISAFKVAWHEADMHGDEGNRTRRGIRAARKVIEGDRK